VAEGRWLTLLCLLQLLISGSRDFLTFYLLLETANMVLYQLLATRWAVGRLSGHQQLRLETLLGYFLVNLLGSLLLLLGFGFLHVATGTLNFGEVSLLLRCSPAGMDLVMGQGLTLGLLTALCGLLLKLGLAPFHFWVAPIYEGLPHFIYVYLMIFPKGGLLLLLLQWGASLGLNGNQPLLERALLLLAALNLVWGTLGALHQTSLRRLLIYSSLANLSLVLCALAVGGEGVSASGTQYLLLYLLTSASLLLPLGALAESGSLVRWSLPELSRGCHPRLRVLLSLGLLNLSGVPPFGLFFGKVAVALELAERGFYFSLGLLLLFSVVAVAYAFQPLLALWCQDQPLSGAPLTVDAVVADGELPHQLLLAFGVVLATELLEAQPIGVSDWELNPLLGLGLTVLDLQLLVQPLLLTLLLLTLWLWELSATNLAQPFSVTRGLGEGVGTPADGAAPQPEGGGANIPDGQPLSGRSGGDYWMDPHYFDDKPFTVYRLEEFSSELNNDPDLGTVQQIGELLARYQVPGSTINLVAQHLGLEEELRQHLQQCLALSPKTAVTGLTMPPMPTPAHVEEVAPETVVAPTECFQFSEDFCTAVANYGWPEVTVWPKEDVRDCIAMTFNRCLQGFPRNPAPLTAEQAQAYGDIELPKTPSPLLTEGCTKAANKLAEALWERVHGENGFTEPDHTAWVQRVSAKCLEGLGTHPEYLAHMRRVEDTFQIMELPFWSSAEHYHAHANIWCADRAMRRMKRLFERETLGVGEKPASAADVPAFGEILQLDN
jgi:NADH:ubiquinone oxidoreductase subunit 2 (subunit N)